MYIRQNRVMKSINPKGFTLVEIIIVVVILSIVSLLAIPMVTSASSYQLKSAATSLAADLEHVKSMAVSRQQSYKVIFDSSSDSYEVRDSVDNVVSHSTKSGGSFSVTYDSNSGMDAVDITSADFDSEEVLVFNYLGAPYNNGGTAMVSGSVTLESDGATMTVSVEPVTGYITIQ